jgi:hypothetical protein
MSYLLQLLLLSITAFGWYIAATAYGIFPALIQSHIILSIPFIIGLIFVLAFVMFYFIGVRQLMVNVMQGLQGAKREQLAEYFEGEAQIPSDLTPYLSKLNRFYYLANQAKRKSIPWCILILILGILSFLLGAAHHTNVVDKSIHAGVVLGYLTASTLGCIWMIKHLRTANQSLRDMKSLFGLKSHQM